MSNLILYSTNHHKSATLARVFEEYGHCLVYLPDPTEVCQILQREIFDAAIICADAPDETRHIVIACRDAQPMMPVVIVEGEDPAVNAEQARELGAAEFLKRNVEPASVLMHTEKALEAARLRAEHAYLIDQVMEGEKQVYLAGTSEAMATVRALITKVSRSRSTVLLTGESGTEKELVAHAIHQASLGSKHPLVKVNCPGIPAQLFESELFGHMKGSFTGATESQRGKFELAGKGNILLDEVSELPLELQAKLLRVLESRRFTRVGGANEIEAQARVIAATNRDLKAMVKEGRFREDLYYRLNVFPIELPPVRDRKEDLKDTALHLLGHIGSSCGLTASGIDKDAMHILKSYNWPGNVRELRNVLERSLVLAGGGLILPEHLPWEVQDAGEGTTDNEEFFNVRVNAYKKKLLLESLRKHAWVKKDAATSLGLSQRAFSHYVARFNLDNQRKSSRPIH
ncbi:MAG: sigma-54-dependent Fis family transcriptional regulator [Deltaproteobacteria bacterium]|nr:sigma-54-dependent Fis family transcriptional regulator [Deltaproteobacteria bacterium]